MKWSATQEGFFSSFCRVTVSHIYAIFKVTSLFRDHELQMSTLFFIVQIRVDLKDIIIWYQVNWFLMPNNSDYYREILL